jgi:hypothetical protein
LAVPRAQLLLKLETSMRRPTITPVVRCAGAAALAITLSAVLAAQSADSKSTASSPAKGARKFATPRTAWGDPDLQGVWDYRTITPLERPQNMAGRATLTDEEVARLEAQAARNLDAPPDENTPVGTVHAPYMTDRGRKVLDDRRTSLIIDPADGRIPPLTPEAQLRAASRRGTRDGGADGPESRSSAERCITYGFPSATLPTLYNNNIRILQGPGYVAVTHEMIHETRIIPLDGRPPVSPKIQQWFGDARGHWEGDTLVVEMRNFSNKTNYRGSGATLHTIERFTRLGKDALEFRLTVDDPHTFVRPWTALLPMRTSEGPIYEYACHEANVGLYDILEVARDEEKKAGGK